VADRVFWQARAGELDEARARGEIDDARWFAEMAAIFEAAYLEGDNPGAQSGFGGDEARWEAARRPIADAIDGDGSFLDVGCASGHLLESLVRWTPHRIDPYGLDLAAALVELARRRLPHWADRIFLGKRTRLGTAAPLRRRPHRARLCSGPPAARACRAPARGGPRFRRPPDSLRLRKPAECRRARSGLRDRPLVGLRA
jgi:SAM-dependent methyltransferase